MSHEIWAILGLAGSLLLTLVVSTWRFSALSTNLLSAVQRLEKKEAEQDQRLTRLDDIPTMKTSLAYVEKNHSLIPGLISAVRVLETKAEFSKEMRAVRASRPDIEE